MFLWMLIVFLKFVMVDYVILILFWIGWFRLYDLMWNVFIKLVDIVWYCVLFWVGLRFFVNVIIVCVLLYLS